MYRKAVIRKCKESDLDPDRPESEQKWCLYTKDGSRLLGRHPTKESAKDQEEAIQISKHSFLYLVIEDLEKWLES